MIRSFRSVLLACAVALPSAAIAQVRVSTLPAAATLTGSEQLLGVQAGASVTITPNQIKTFTGGGSGGSPGGASGGIQYNNSGAFAGGPLSGDCTTAVLVITCTKTSGVAFAPSATSDVTNAANITSGALPSGRLTGSYTGLTGVGTLSAGSIPSTLITGLGTFAGQNYATPPAIGGTTPAAGSFSALTDTGVSGSTQCLQANTSGVVSGFGAPCGGSPGGSSGNIQTNNGSGGFGSIANLTLTAPASAATFTLAGGKTLTVSNTLTVAGTDGTTMTFPSTSSTVMTLATPGIITGGMQVGGSANINFSGSGSKLLLGSQAVAIVTAPTITSGLGTSPVVTNNSGTAAFLLTAGATGTPTTTTVIGLAAASHGWMCDAVDLTTNADTAKETATATNSVTLTWNTAPSNSDQIAVKCAGY